MLQRVLSYLFPRTEIRVEGHFGPLEVRWENGRKVLNSALGNQSFGALHRVWQKTFKHLELLKSPPKNVLMLGLGGGSVPTILRKELRIPSPITAVELDPQMVELANKHFGLGEFANVKVITGDATIQVHAIRERFDLVLVDLFDDLDLARGVDTGGFLHGLRDRCAAGGTLCFNTVAYDDHSETRCQRVFEHAQRVFHELTELRLEGINRMFIAR